MCSITTDNSRTEQLLNELGTDSQDSISKLNNAKIGIYVSAEWYNCPNGKITIEFLIDILIRMTSVIVLNVEGIKSLDTDDFINTIRRNILSLNKSLILNTDEECTINIIIGNQISIDKCQVYISSNGWQAYSDSEVIDIDAVDSIVNPVGAALAAAFGAAEVFKLILKDDLETANQKPRYCTKAFSAFHYNKDDKNPELPSSINIDEVLLIGAGAVGMSFINLLKHINVQGKLTIIDHDLIDKSNLNRYLGTYTDDIGKLKTVVAKSVLSPNDNLEVVEINMKYQRYIESFGRSIDIAICTVDNDKTRQDLQSDLPRIILNGVTGQSAFTISRHDFINDACLGCLYPDEKDVFTNEEAYTQAMHITVGDFTNRYENDIPMTQNDINNLTQHLDSSSISNDIKAGMTLREFFANHEICGRLNIPNAPQINGTIGFVSAIPGILLVAELIKEKYFSEYSIKNTYHANTLSLISKNSFQNRRKIDECSCYCNSPIMKDIYTNKFIKSTLKGKPHE